MKKLVLFGDSHLGKIGRSRIISLEAKLDGEYDVYNCSAGGWNSQDLVSKSEYIAGLKPDITVFSDGTNDIDPPKDVELSVFRQNIKKLLDNFQDSRLVFIPPIPMNEALLTDEDKHLTNQELKTYYEAAKQVIADKGAELVDSWGIFGPLLDRSEAYHEPDGIHLNDHGYELLLSGISEAIKS
jgi:lysophospholipase L1-like esterase